MTFSPMTMTKKTALWRIVEEMTPEERLDFLVGNPEVLICRRGSIPGEPEQVMTVCEHTPLYIKARRSFFHSREWKQFSQMIEYERNQLSGRKEPSTADRDRGLLSQILYRMERVQMHLRSLIRP